MTGAGPSETRSVLVTDDDGATRFLIRAALEQDGWVVEEAADGSQACASLDRVRPDLVLLDVDMPGVDGFKTCAHLRSLDGGQLVPVLMITGVDDQESVNRAYEAGATDFLSKPFNITILRQRVQYMYRSLEATRALERERDFVSAIVDTSMALVLILDPTGRIVRFNRSCERVSGFSSEEATGQRAWDLLISPQDRDAERLRFNGLVSERDTSQYEGVLTTKDGSTREIAWSNSVLLNRDGELEHVVCTGLDTTERNQAEERVRFLASFDPTTGLPNRRQFAQHLDQAVAAAKAGGPELAVLFLGLDRLGHVNATWGHEAADQLLVGVAGRLAKSLRLSDLLARQGPGLRAELGRAGGNGFAALLTGVSDAPEVAAIIERLQSALSRPFTIEGQSFTVTSSVGAALHPADGHSSDSLLRNSESAMHAAREEVGQTYHFYSAALHTSVSGRLALEGELRQAIDREEFELYYQPKVFAESRRLAGAEALIRWNHPSRGLVMPATFIQIAEETGLIAPIGEWVLRQAGLQVMSWLESGLQPVPVAVNLSSAQFRLKDLLGSIANILNEIAMDTHYLAVEVTESMIMRDPREAHEFISCLDELGVRVAIDDFGTGYSSLSALKDLPVHTLKIDKAFISDLSENPKNLAITKAMIAMAHGMGLAVVAEGVESEEVFEVLRAEGCDEVQGFLISKAVPSDQFEAFLREPELCATDRDEMSVVSA